MEKGVNAEYFRGAACHHITVQSNIMGLNVDGISTILFPGQRPGDPDVPATNDHCLYFDKATDLFIGGEDPARGNILNADNEIFCEGHPDPAVNDSLLIINNKLGIDINDDMLPTASITGIYIQLYNKQNSTTRADAGIIIRKNYIAGRSRNIGIGLSGIESFLLLNKISLAEKRGVPFRNASIDYGISLADCAMGILGDSGPGNENQIRYCRIMAVLLNSTSDITVRHNSTYCNTRGLFIYNWLAANGARPRPLLQLTDLTRPRVLYGVRLCPTLPLTLCR
ncbi:hypothetical protein [Paraflavitalea speifideaquila]|uniref:hypothetical protein n=1 Tax=Paraflavitalea speifideaquila TaxID=3076558 RepID=UPI0028E74B0F|nr:hypothetical protein [Paraflavitalea speifideiaquila]